MPSARLLLFLAVLAAALPAHAGTRRLAVLVGHNVGSGERPPLRYAEADASKLAGVLTELGDVAPPDLFILQGRNLATVRGALEGVARKVASLRAQPDTRVVLLFYFSGHSDGVALELGTERLPYAELRQWLEATRADVRLAIVDSCRSGALLRIKGGRPGPTFELRLTDELHSSGHALLTSSAEDELALESREVGGSLFTHHLVSGLRGAADSSGDGLVTLAEAYQYAYAHTVSATADVLLGGQHPAYDYRLSGKGELVLTQLPSPGTALELPTDFERALLLRPGRGQVMAELGPGAVPRLAVPPGQYELRAWRAGRQHTGAVSAPSGKVTRVRWEDLTPMAPSTAVASSKGPAETEVPMAAWTEQTPGPQGTMPLQVLEPGASGQTKQQSGALASAAVQSSAPEASTSARTGPRGPDARTPGSLGSGPMQEAEGARTEQPTGSLARGPMQKPDAEASSHEQPAGAVASMPLQTPERVAATVEPRPAAPTGAVEPQSASSLTDEPFLRLGVLGGLRQAVADGVGPLQSLRLELSGAAERGPVLSVELARGAGLVGREAAGAVSLGYRWSIRHGAVEAAAGVEAGAEFIRQSSGQGIGWALAPGLGPTANLSWNMAPRLALQLGVRVPLAILRQDGHGELRVLPSAGLGVRLGL